MMADTVNKLVDQAVENITESVANATAKSVPPTAAGMAIAYGSLVVMAILPIFFGSHRSVRHHREQKEHFEISGEKPETMSRKDAAMFPLISSVALFGLYIFFQLFSKEYINLLLTGYFFFLGILALCHLSSPLITSLVPAAIPKTQYHLHLTEDSEDIINYKFNLHDIVCLICCSMVGAWYLWEKHWIANNLLGIAFAINGVELLHLNNVVTGCILLCGLFVYDIFWVFGTNVMVTVARSFEAPIKLVFPQDLLEQGLHGTKFAMLGLGDIVVPGIFIALLLRFDHSLKRKANTYFYSTFFAYFMGLLVTLLFMQLFNHAQPALLYLVPACLGTPLCVAIFKGDLKALFSYEDHPSDTDTDTKTETTQIDGKKEK
ncbi:minor histocompatibility antigen H13 [Copidosoma floridanum]|uniref:minor histocompatibility antigen H13 n=1 Tax=Copidosoma floridanum TaxID=29053 RepID=UPI0006C944D3|nr:minor histocompatibility antigen H13 [Copidosoma floridanum]XP_014207132.1 minor histocompatibility antigen H13 [Copidosoma floridanum]